MNPNKSFIKIPKASNPEMAKVGLELFKSEDYVPQDVIMATFGNSTYLSQLMTRQKDFVCDVFKRGYRQCFDEVIAEIENFDVTESNQNEIMSYLRVMKQKISLLIAVADITNKWNLEEVTGALSDFADIAIQKTLEFLIYSKTRDNLFADFSLEDSGLIIMAVGKLGGRELNYSSDVDLVALYDAEQSNYSGTIPAKEFFIGLTRDMVHILQQRTADGYVFRVDLRLRPDPYPTAIAVSTNSAEVYYENVGQNWERAAMIKARFVAGDESVAQDYLQFLGSFIWRKYLDFEAIEDIHSIKRQIDSNTDFKPDTLLGYNIKLGKGGIREIEFFAQVQQLIWGGRNELLRGKSTCPVLLELEKEKHITKQAAQDLIHAYEFYRNIEHRLQMVADEQSHTLPLQREEFDNFTIFMGYDSPQEFSTDLRKNLALVQGYYARLFTESPSLGASGNLVFTGVSNDPETLLTIGKMGFKNAERVCEIIRGWHHGRRRATRFKRVREILTELTPNILESFAKSSEPDIAFVKFDDFLTTLPSGVQLFSLFETKPELIDLIAEIMGNSPWLAQNFSRSPGLVTRILSSDFYSDFPDSASLLESIELALSHGKTFEEKMKIIHRWKHDMEFQVGIRLLKNLVPKKEAGVHLSNIADIVVSNVLSLVKKRHQSDIKGEIAIVALGKLGNYELMFGSDLDLVFVYSSNDANASSYFLKIAQDFNSEINTLTEDGVLYNVDTRLRPSGAQGSLATSYKAFQKYYNDAAWSWEYMALTKARTIAGDKNLQKELSDYIFSVLTQERDKKKFAKDIWDMRGKIAQSFTDANPWDLKYAKGGFFEIEFIIQYFRLTESRRFAEILELNNKTFWHVLKSESVISNHMGNELEESYGFLRDLQSITRLLSQVGFDPEHATQAQKNIIAQSFGENDFDRIAKRLLDTENIINKYFNNIFNLDNSE